MSDLAHRFEDALQRGENLDLSNVPTAELAAASELLADTPVCVIFFQRLLEAETPSTSTVAISLVATANDPGVMAEVVRYLVASSRLAEDVVRCLHETLLNKSGNRELFQATRAQSLLGALCLSQERPSLLRRLQSHLLDVDLQDDGDYLRHVAKIDGLLLAHVQDQDLNTALQGLLSVPEAEDEASFSLGLLAVSAALNADKRESALEAFGRARDLMQRAVDASEDRQDAFLYLTCLDVLLAFQDGARDNSLQAKLMKVHRAAFEYSAVFLPSDRPIDRDSWLGISSLEGLRWAELGTRLSMLDVDILKAAWLNAARVIEEGLLKVFEASRSILRRNTAGGVEAIVRPRIVGALQTNRVQLALLDQWLSEHEDSLSARTAMTMRAEVDAAMEASLCRNPLDAAATPVTAAAILAKAGLPEVLNTSAQNLLSSAVAALELTRTEPIICEVFETIHNNLLGNPDYQGEARTFFIQILHYTIAFVASRENLSASSVPGIEYLFNRDLDSPPIERDLHKDYFGFLQSTPLRELAQSESRDVAHGRVDVCFARNGVKTVAELKKTHNNRTLGRLADEFGLQAIAYQRTNVRFCILMVLDLFDRGGGSDHLSNLVGVFQRTPSSGTTSYSVIAFRVQGMKKTPAYLR